jgi:membrane protein required for colicin V production
VSFSAIDFIFIGLIALFMIRCFLKGFVSELLSMAAVVLGLLAALFFHKNGGVFLRNQFWPELKVIPEIAAFIILFIIVFLVVKIIEKMLVNIINNVSLSGANSFLGLIFGLAEGIVVVCLILLFLKIQPLFDASSLLQNSFFARLLLPLIAVKEKIISV